MNKILTPKGIAVAVIVIACVILLGWWIYAAHTGSGTAPQTGMTATSSVAMATGTTTGTTGATGNNGAANAALGEKVYAPVTPPASAASCTTMGCFVTAAQTCSPATLAWTGVIDVSPLFSENVLSNLAVKGLNEYKECIFTDYVKSASGIVTPQYQTQASAEGLTTAQMQQEVTYEANQTTGVTSECTFDETTLAQLLTQWSEGPISAGAFTVANCTSVAASGANTTAGPGPASTAVQAKSGTVTLQNGSDATIENLEFKVTSVTSASISMTVINHTTAQSAAIVVNNNASQNALGYNFSIVSIKEITTSSPSGQPTFSNEATISFTQQ